jgi:hypothetical protein
MAVEMDCQDCGSFGGFRTLVKGSLSVEIVLWACFLVPGMIYSIWRLITAERVCPMCGSPNMIQVDSPTFGLVAVRAQGQTLQRRRTSTSNRSTY